MKIAYLTSVYARASDTFVRNEVIELRRRGHEVHTFSIRREPLGANALPEVKQEQASTTYILEQPLLQLLTPWLMMWATRPANMAKACKLAWQTRKKGLKGTLLQGAYLLEAAYLARRLDKAGVHILHNHIAENSANVAMLCSTMSGIPYSLTVHGPGIFFHPREWALGEKIARSSFTATITDFCRSQCMLFSDSRHWAKLKVVRCSVGPDFHVDELQAMPAKKRLVFVGRLCEEKGLPILLEAAQRLARDGFDFELAIIGDGPLRREVEALSKQPGLDGRIALLGWRSSKEVRQELEASQGLILPSFAEGLPVVIMEALALGRPVITTQIAGIPELVEPGICGWLTAPGSVDGLTQAMSDFLSQPPERLAEMGRAGAALVNTRHNFSREISKLEGMLVQHAASP